MWRVNLKLKASSGKGVAQFEKESILGGDPYNFSFSWKDYLPPKKARKTMTEKRVKRAHASGKKGLLALCYRE